MVALRVIENQSPLIVVVGPTGSGKSSLSMSIAQRYNGEIICADSRTIYKDMDIGTAKPTLQDREKVQHHLLDLVKPDETFTAADFQEHATKALDGIAARGRLAILTGGTGLYVDSLLFNYSFLNKSSMKLREKLQQLDTKSLLSRANRLGIDVSHIDTANIRYLRRAIETKGANPQKASAPRANTLIIGLNVPRSILRTRIEQRAEAMFRRGLRKEVKKLAESYSWDIEAMKGIGYREFRNYFEGKQSLSATKRQIVQSSLQLAKRQRTWFKRNRFIHWIDNESDAFILVEDFLSGTI